MTSICKEISDLEICDKQEGCMINKNNKCQKIPKKRKPENTVITLSKPINILTSKQKIKQRRIHSIKPEKTRKRKLLKNEISSLPVWYKIPEIRPNDFITCVKGIYSVLEKTHKTNTIRNGEDPFIKAVVTGFNNMNQDDWIKAESSRISQKVLEMKMGDFHEELMGKIPGYETYKNGHITGCDVGSVDGHEIYEVKNKNNTTKGSDGKHIIDTLTKLLHQGKHPIFTQINCANGRVSRFNAPYGVDVWDGKKTYHHMTGRETFFDDLENTMKHVFSTCKTLEELKVALGTS